MRYFYEYKEKNGSEVGGHNLEEIRTVDGQDRYIKLIGVDIINDISSYWCIVLDMSFIEYLTIRPMEDEK